MCRKLTSLWFGCGEIVNYEFNYVCRVGTYKSFRIKGRKLKRGVRQRVLNWWKCHFSVIFEYFSIIEICLIMMVWIGLRWCDLQGDSSRCYNLIRLLSRIFSMVDWFSLWFFRVFFSFVQWMMKNICVYKIRSNYYVRFSVCFEFRLSNVFSSDFAGAK